MLAAAARLCSGSGAVKKYRDEKENRKLVCAAQERDEAQAASGFSCGGEKKKKKDKNKSVGRNKNGEWKINDMQKGEKEMQN